MPSKIRLTPRELNINEDEGFTIQNDPFSLREFGERLANLVIRTEGPLVIALDGPWGSGKSVFARQWQGLLRSKNVPVIFFDAFASDYQEDGFIALSAEITNFADQTLGSQDPYVESFKARAARAGRVLMPWLAKTAVRAATLGVVNATELGEAVEEIVSSGGDEAATAAEKYVTERLERSQADRNALEAFRQQLSSIAEKLAAVGPGTGQEEAVPLVIIIDELDRCRPSFAVSLIERIKHLFAVEGVCFVLVTHLEQVESAIKGTYGALTDARTYLEKFYHLRATLPSSQGERHLPSSSERYLNTLWTDLNIPSNRTEHRLVQDELARLARVNALQLRTLQRIASNVAILLAGTPDNHLLPPPIIAGLCVMRHLDPALFKNAKNGRLSCDDALRFLSLPDVRISSDDATRHEAHWQARWWVFATSTDLDASWRDFDSTLFRYNTSRERIVPYFAERLDAFTLPTES